MNDVYLITIDALRRDHFNNQFFSKSFRSGLNEFAHFSNCYSNGVATPLSFPSIHTGKTVIYDGKLSGPTIAELYEGYTFAISNNAHLRADRGYNRGFDDFNRKPETPTKNTYKKLKHLAGKSKLLSNIYNTFWNTAHEMSVKQPDLSPPTNRTAKYVLSLLLDNIKIDQNGFYWVHLMDAHHPYYPQKVTDKTINTGYNNNQIEKINKKIRRPARRSMGLELSNEDLEPPSAEEINFCRRIYTEIIKYIDRSLAYFFRKLKQKDQWEQSMIIVLSDHGEAFGEQGVFQHDWSANPINPLVKVPLMVKYPQGQYADESFSHAVQTADLLATLNEALGWNVDTPVHTKPFTEKGLRPIISKSNAAIRATTDDGYAILRGDTIVETEGCIDDEALSVLRSSSLPNVETMGGDIPGVTQREQKDIEDRLEYLGYK